MTHLQKLRERIWNEFLQEVEKMFKDNYTVNQMAVVLKCEEADIRKALKQI